MSVVRSIARIAYEVNRAYCDAAGDVAIPAGPPWDEQDTEGQRRYYVAARAYLADPNMTDEQAHEMWVAARLNDGWVFGETLDPQLRRHPCMVPWVELPEAQQLKVRLAKAVVFAANDRLAAQEQHPQRPTFYSARAERIGLAYDVCESLISTMPLEERSPLLFEEWTEVTLPQALQLLTGLAAALEPPPEGEEAPVAPTLEGVGNQAWIEMFNVVYKGVLVAHGIA